MLFLNFINNLSNYRPNNQKKFYYFFNFIYNCENFCVVILIRVIAGRRKGLELISPKNGLTRPTSGIVKEALFSMLNSVDGASFLDLFAGCGAIGIEAISRGCGSACFVEKNPANAAIIKKNLSRAGFLENARVVTGDAVKFAENGAFAFEIIFLDPPYESGLVDVTLRAARKNAKGVLVVQGHINETFDARGFTVIKSKKYGQTRLVVLKPDRPV